MIDKLAAFLTVIWVGMTNPVTIALVLGALITIGLACMAVYVPFRVARFVYRLAVATSRKSIEQEAGKVFDELERQPVTEPRLEIVPT